MTIQTFWSSTSFTSFPSFTAGFGGGSTAQLLWSLTWDTTARMMIGEFRLGFNDNDPTFTVVGGRSILDKVWRDGKLLEALPIIPKSGFVYQTAQPSVLPTLDGRVCRYTASSTQGGDFWGFLLNDGDNTSFGGNAYYRVSPIWPGDLLTHSGDGRLGEVSHMFSESSGGLGMLLPATSSVYTMFNEHRFFGSDRFRVIHKSDTFSTTVVSVNTNVVNGFSDWDNARQMIPIDNSTVAITFRPRTFLLVPDENAPARIRVFDTNSVPWTHLWTDFLPGVDQVAAYDPEEKVLYSCGKRQNNAVMHASKLLRVPSVGSASIQGDLTELPTLTRTGLSVTVIDALASVISGQLVQWTIDTPTQGAFLNSNYSKTNNSGVASITYISPNATTPFVTRVNTVVAEINRG